MLIEDERLFSLVNAGTIQVAKALQDIDSYYISNIDNLEALAEVDSQSDSRYELANLDFSTRALNIKPKKLPRGIKLLQNLPIGTKLLQNLPNGKKISLIYRMEQKHWGVEPPSPSAKSYMLFNRSIVYRLLV